ncbi:helix-turn-helix transcriptional regulator [Microlunatus speluncae]|uniref:helix-turn-helix transcriptional regulator n=1 Tax=Microlunatus speluncae TaxID=2594267 RepID=UPI00126665E6|nr:WYL domain-containing protein [Microlunatus speluncae]
MRETSARLLRLLSLLQGPVPRSGTELTERLGVDARTVRRDIERLRDLGYPVETTPGVAGYRLGAGAGVPPLLLDDDEAVAVAIGLRTAAAGTVAGIEESSLRALTKLEQVLPSRLRHRVRTLGSVTVPVPAGTAAVDPAVLAAVAAACAAHEQLRFDYASGPNASRRRTEPHRLLHTGRHWYLLAWDLDRADWRTFRLDRLRPRTPTGPRFTPREAPEVDTASGTVRRFSTGGYRYTGRFTLHVPAQVAADRITPSVGYLEPAGDDRCTLVAGSDSLDELILYVGLFGFEFEAHEPPELITRIQELCTLLTRATTAP